jgi:hypothetical protein
VISRQLILALAGLTIISCLFLLPINSVHLQAFTSSASTEPLAPVVLSSEQTQSPIPGLLMPGTASSVQQQQGPIEGFVANGTINSIIFTPKIKWIATGNWSMIADNGNLTSFKTNMIWYNNNGTATHTHELQNFRPINAGKITLQPGNSVFLKGVMDVGTNHRIVWKNVHSTVDIRGGKTITIFVDSKDTNNHFAGQPMYGVVTSFTY